MEQDLPFIVQELIEGANLVDWVKSHRPPREQIVRLMIEAADAVGFAHRQRFVHRDLKPANILVDGEGHPHVADFGLAVHETAQRERQGEVSGTPAYMPPEQVRGETHRLDGRSDLWSLGVILYELLTGKRPFQGRDHRDLFDEICTRDPRPPRQLDPTIPKELERICLKGLQKRATDRYASAADFVDDLRHWLEKPETGGGRSGREKDEPQTSAVRIVPKGLRSFDEHDADFFLDLLPGARDRDGLPESIRFWKTRIEECDPDKTFTVGLIYGPSGCGKSSLVKAGLLPRLSDTVISVYLEATPDQTESRLLHGLRKHCPALDETLDLIQTLAALRRGQGIPVGKKVLIILDQFEQWLHAKKEEENTELVQALRQCDGARVQTVVMVRDDFWMAATRFITAVEIELVPGKNIAAVDLFDQRHARKVLAAFGRAFGALPMEASALTTDQGAFLDQSVSGLAEDGKVISVRLALFAEMFKGKSWVPQTLKEVGGTQGVGITFLEDTFSSSRAIPKHRLHQKAARAVLKSLLPDSGTDIKGQMKSYAELLDASGYASRPRDFDDLIRILDSEIRLITPTDPEGNEEREKSEERSVKVENVTSSPSPSPLHNSLFFQLTHDYLVPSLREWLTQKQKETRRGRAELKLQERSAAWNAKPEMRQLPSFLEHASIRWLTDKRKWTEPQRKMMSKAGWIHGTRTALALTILVVASIAAVATRRYVNEQQNLTQARERVETLVNADTSQVPGIVAQLRELGRWSQPLLRDRLGRAADNSVEKLHLSLALVRSDETQVPYLYEQLLHAEFPRLGVIRETLAPQQSQLAEKLWAVLHDATASSDQRFRAGLALAGYSPNADSWTAHDLTFLAQELVAANPEQQSRLREYLRALGPGLLGDLTAIFVNASLPETHQLAAANALADFARDDGARLANLLTMATAAQYKILFPLVKAEDGAAREVLSQFTNALPAVDLSSIDRVSLGQRRAGAAITLLRQGERETIFEALRVRDDPESLTQFVHRCRDRGVTVAELLDCLDRADVRRQKLSGEARKLEDRVVFGLVLALGEFTLDEVPGPNRQALLERLGTWYGSDPSSGIHGATGWLLRQWGQDAVVEAVDHTPVPYSPGREWYTVEFKATASGLSAILSAEQTYYMTFVVFEPGEYLIGSPEDERERDETRHMVRLTRRFALLDREVTRGEYESFGVEFSGYEQFSPSLQHAMGGPSWYEAVRYCRWLGERVGILESEQAYLNPGDLDASAYPAEPDPSAKGAPRNWPVRLDARGFRLPTESEWELACRSGMVTSYGFGGDSRLLGFYGWYVENSGKKIHEPKRQRPNLRGLFDLHGNLYEWCHDWLDTYSSGLAVDPAGPAQGSFRVYRGGGWGYVAAFCRLANRLGSQPTNRNTYFGFRPAQVPVAGPELQSGGAGGNDPEEE